MLTICEALQSAIGQRRRGDIANELPKVIGGGPPEAAKNKDGRPDLWHGRVPALPGDASTFVPVVPADHLADFMAALPDDPSTAGASYWVLDDDTPPLPELLTAVAHHYRVRVPRLRIPVGVLKRLPSWLTKMDPETLTFMSADRYPTGPAADWAGTRGLVMPETVPALLRWADYLAAHRFGAVPSGRGRRFVDYAGARTFEIGPPDASTLVLPGLPVNADTWADTAAVIGARVLDLPGLGMSSGHAPWTDWLEAAMRGGSAHLVGHSIGAAAAVEAAAAHPDRIERLTLVAPAFLQEPGRIPPAWLVGMYLRRITARGLSRRLTGTAVHAEALGSSVADLRRHSAETVAGLLVKARKPSRRQRLVDALDRFGGPVHIITGETDPLADWAAARFPNARFSVVPGAGHNPQLTHAAGVAELIGA